MDARSAISDIAHTGGAEDSPSGVVDLDQKASKRSIEGPSCRLSQYKRPGHHGDASSGSCQLDDHWCGFGGSFALVPSEPLSALALSPSHAVVSTVNTPCLSLHLCCSLLVTIAQWLNRGVHSNISKLCEALVGAQTLPSKQPIYGKTPNRAFARQRPLDLAFVLQHLEKLTGR